MDEVGPSAKVLAGSESDRPQEEAKTEEASALSLAQTPSKASDASRSSRFDLPDPCKWLPALISSTNFFQSCLACQSGKKASSYQEASRRVVNFICLDCADPDGLCHACLHEHEGHRVMQIRRSSYHDVVRVNEMSKLLNTEGIQTYVINSSRVVFLKERPQSRSQKALGTPATLAGTGGGGADGCLWCRRNLHDGMLYCSLACKANHCTGGEEIGQSLPPGLNVENKLHHSSSFLASFLHPATPQPKRGKRKYPAGSPMQPSPPSSVKSKGTIYHKHRRKGFPRRSPCM
mmetsp:Transcript_3625/g.9096  ORF Transcript_3625/g.9096 Transcript_3625/m.9096 type:complete len:290 (+) Transcript_3625:314-1183(+)